MEDEGKCGTDVPMATVVCDEDGSSMQTSTLEGDVRMSCGKAVVAGAAAGLMEALAIQPFDMIKTRFQLNSGKNPSIWSAAGTIFREGGVLRFYRGLLPEVCGMVPKSSVMFATYQSIRENLLVSGVVSNQITAAALAGAGGGIAEAVVVTPFQVVKVRLQTREFGERYRHSLHCCNRVLQEEGVLALFRGLGPTCWRNAVWTSIYFGLMEYGKEQLYSKNSDIVRSEGVGVIATFLFGTGAGVVATLFNAPFDVVKSRAQSSPQLVSSSNSTFYMLYIIWRREGGLSAIYKGLTPKLCRMGVGGGVSIMVYDILMRL
eukprot:gb/GEZN01012646.1/.p1 GENE.gb/GEZN01012646.1/~~gb/GEZN01012646.1/.p1  ORF type:complete len:318 (+),score=29.65 gb/GEZN01012646.1/:42-995(+)